MQAVALDVLVISVRRVCPASRSISLTERFSFMNKKPGHLQNTP
ncbi:hypothetical protein EaACW_2370 [Erwinia amylovora ACW56400]|uniref:Uncharacterized protein n=1 Tax=Erwinia amylovora NBRC 12687 = CFBP 1232 TaxID=1219359 RepID=A0A831ERE9_ERWAM|nr:hypothetical protein EaACW_2370 [Erwinia amylovora ACW56400]CCO79214.1 hypothetical protein BN432_2427 [Erwinia amylovora Ea356]CCO83018.1 hypothetical protein BN433_2458 [Erwinia amylovora Ea266]CCO90577.1 hypothetical protein BN435_2418 [Erwinia amylovora 01SFR-BO]CCO94349.1 hypothetical protein BN437_2431 [Erwinia amylovora NBRC 12687 = CFBP 1232]CCO99691.1 hypothetical protein BN438_2419 [Erwinia amylovora UPN527]